MSRRRVLFVAFVAAGLCAAYFESRRAGVEVSTANGGGPSDGARDVTGSHPLPNETAAPEPKSGCSAAPGR
jgi:hypothetical protein